MEVFIPIIFVIIAGWLYAINDGDKYLDGSIRGGIKAYEHLTKKQGPHKKINERTNEVVAIENYKDGLLNGATTDPRDPLMFRYFKMGVLDGYNNHYEGRAFYFAGSTFYEGELYEMGDSVIQKHSFRLNGELKNDRIWDSPSVVQRDYRQFFRGTISRASIYGMSESNPNSDEYDKKVMLDVVMVKGEKQHTIKFLGEDILLNELPNKLKNYELVNTGFEGEKIYYWDEDFNIYKEPFQVMAREFYKDGMKDGIQEYFYESGVLEYRLNYEAGVPSGIWKWYSEDGQYTKSIDCSKILQ